MTTHKAAPIATDLLGFWREIGELDPTMTLDELRDYVAFMGTVEHKQAMWLVDDLKRCQADECTKHEGNAVLVENDARGLLLCEDCDDAAREADAYWGDVRSTYCAGLGV